MVPSASSRTAQEVSTVAASVCHIQSSLCEYCDSFGQLRRKIVVALQDKVATSLQAVSTSKSPQTATNVHTLITTVNL